MITIVIMLIITTVGTNIECSQGLSCTGALEWILGKGGLIHNMDLNMNIVINTWCDKHLFHMAFTDQHHLKCKRSYTSRGFERRDTDNVIGQSSLSTAPMCHNAIICMFWCWRSALRQVQNRQRGKSKWGAQRIYADHEI